jgi:hypothetical protein
MMTDDERNKLLQNVDDARKLAHMLKLMTEFKSVVAMDDQPDHALLLMKEVCATYNSLPADVRQGLDKKFQPN